MRSINDQIQVNVEWASAVDFSEWTVRFFDIVLYLSDSGAKGFFRQRELSKKTAMVFLLFFFLVMPIKEIFLQYLHVR